MRFISFSQAGNNGVAVLDTNGSPTGSLEGDADDPGELDAAVARGAAALREAGAVLAKARPVDLSGISYRPVLVATSRRNAATSARAIFCDMLNLVVAGTTAGRSARIPRGERPPTCSGRPPPAGALRGAARLQHLVDGPRDQPPARVVGERRSRTVRPRRRKRHEYRCAIRRPDRAPVWFGGGRN